MKEWFWIVAIVILVIAIVAFGGWLLMILWNWIMPFIFGLPKITFWMALGISLLVSILFKTTIKKN